MAVRTAEPAAPGTGRRKAFVVLAAVLGLVVGVLGFGLIALVVGWFESGDREVHRIHDLAWGATGGLYVSLGLLLQVVKPERKIAAMQMVALGIAAILIPILIADPGEAIIGVVVAAAVIALLVYLHPARIEFFAPGTGFSPVLAGLAVLAAVLFAKFAADQIDIMGECIEDLDEHCEEGHYAQMASVGVGALLVGLLAAFKTRGWLIPARAAAASMVVFGLSQLVLSDDLPGHVGAGWGVAAVVGGIVYAAVAQLEAGKDTPLQTPS